MGTQFAILRAALVGSFCVPIKLSLWNSHQIKIFAQQERISSWILEKRPLRHSNGGSKGVKIGFLGVKSYLSFDLHQIWWEGAFLQVIKQSFIRFAFFLLWVPRLTPRRGQMGVKWGSNLIWTLIFTKFGGKEHFCKLLKDLTLDFAIFWLWVPRLTLRRGQMGVKWGSNGGQTLFELWSSPNLVGRSVFASC